MVSLAEAVVKSVFRQLLCGVMFLHKHGVVHRDLKPANILIAGAPGRLRLKITDFNVAKFVDEHPFDVFGRNNFEMGSHTGTLAFKAPETFIHDRYSESVDLWSCGCILYTLLSGYQPFYASVVGQMVEQIKKAKYDFNDPVWLGVSDLAKDLVRKLLNPESSKRATAHEALAHSWFSKSEFLAGGHKYSLEFKQNLFVIKKGPPIRKASDIGRQVTETNTRINTAKLRTSVRVEALILDDPLSI